MVEQCSCLPPVFLPLSDQITTFTSSLAIKGEISVLDIVLNFLYSVLNLSKYDTQPKTEKKQRDHRYIPDRDGQYTEKNGSQVFSRNDRIITQTNQKHY